MVYQPVDRGDGHGLIWEDPVPCTEGLVGSDREASIFVSSCDEFEEDGAFGSIFLGICDVVQNDEIEFVEFCECGFQGEILSRGLKSLHEVGCSAVKDAVSGLDEGMADSAEDMGLAGAGVSDGDEVGPGFEPVPGGEGLDAGPG